MLGQLIRRISPDSFYWHGGHYVRVYKDEHGFGWQIYRDDKFVYSNGHFVGLIDGGHCRELADSHKSAQEYIDNCLERDEQWV